MSNSPKKLANKAILIIRNAIEDQTNISKYFGRKFDDCFEQGNGKEVVIEFMKIYENDKHLQISIHCFDRYIAIDSWKDTYQEYLKKYPSLL